MSKLSKIELDDFRVFQGHNPFEFLNPVGKPYNFICIYGLNGSGKTSFVDALEWLATGKLHRIESDMQVQGDTYVGPILTHRTAYDASRRAKVTAQFIETNQEVHEQRRHLQMRRGSVNDYLSGISTGSGLTPIQILPQSKIAGFVSAEKPEQRFTSWTELAAPDDMNFSLMVRTYRLKTKIKSIWDDSITESKKLEDQITKCSLNDKVITAINNAILSYNEAYATISSQEKSITLIHQNNSGVYQIPDLSSIKALQLQTASELEKLHAREPLLQQLLEGYSTYQKSLNDLAIITKQESTYNEKIKRIQQKKEIDTLTRSLTSLYDALSYILQDCIEDANDKARITTEQKNSFEKQQKLWLQELEQLEKETVDKKSQSPNTAYLASVERQRAVQSSLRCLEQISDSIKVKKFEIASAQATRLSELYSQKVVDVIRKLSDQDRTIQILTEQCTHTLQRVQEIESSSNEVVAAIELIRAQIENAQIHICPVCQTEFPSFVSLLDRIKHEFSSKELVDARSEHHAKTSLLQGSRDSYQVLLQAWSSAEQEIHNALEEVLSTERKATEVLSSKIEQFDRDIASLDERRNVLRMQLHAVHDFPAPLTLDSFAAWSKNAYQCLCEDVLRNEALLGQFQAVSTDLLAVILSNDNRTLNERYRLETTLHLLPPLQSEKTNNLKKSINEYISKFDLICTKREALPDFAEINPSDFTFYQAKLEEAHQQCLSLKSTIGVYQKVLLDAQLTYQTSIEQMNQLFSKEQIMKSVLETVISSSLIDILCHESELIAYKNQYQRLIQQKSELENKMNATAQAYKRIDVLYSSMCSTQQEVINQVFAGEMVNKLYRLLEPNKDYPKLSFKIEFNSSDRPELYIKAHERGAKDSIVLPELIFSTAQLNTISLCIFLSNALSRPHDMQTLVLDDPISSFDDINTVAFCDLLRILCVHNDWQIIFTTHDEKLFRLLQVKMSSQYHNSLFLQFRDKGQLLRL